MGRTHSMVKGDTRVKRTQFWKDTEKTVTKESKKETRYYPAEDVKSKLRNNHNNSRQTKLRASITPGTVLILLAGHFKGKRVVFLKQMESGLLLVTGPYKVNGVPQSYVIATKTTVDVSKVAVPASVTDALFKKAKTAKKKDEELFFEKDKESVIDDSRKAIQKQVDDKLVAEISKTPLLKAYLSSKFSLKKGQKPHAMTF